MFLALISATTLVLQANQPVGGGLQLNQIEPTVFFVQSKEGLDQRVDLTLSAGAPYKAVEVKVRADTKEMRLELGDVPSGTHVRRIFVPDIRKSMPVVFELTADGKSQDQRTVEWQPVRHWEVHLVHGSHHDLGYTDIPSNVLRQHDEYLDRVVEFCQQTADWPEDAKFRYVVEQAWSVTHYVEQQPAGKIERLAQLMREGRIEVTALFGNETSELCGHEEQIRLVYPSFRLKRRFGIPIRTAELNDIPGVSWGMVSVLAGSGVRHFAPGIPDYYGWGTRVRAWWDEKAVLPRDIPGAFWWEGPDGSRVLFWHTGGSIAGPDLGDYEEAERDLPRYLAGLQDHGYGFDLLRVKFHGAPRDNSPPDIRLSRIVREWNKRWAYPRLIVSTNARFFEQFEKEAGKDLKVLRGELPNTDYTIGAASTAKETGINRLTHDALTSAEKFAACASLVSDDPYPARSLTEAYDAALLYDEHTWGMAHPVGPAQEACWAEKSLLAYHAAALAHDVLAKSTHRIADHVRLADAGHYVVVFNPLAQQRTDVVHVLAAPPNPCSGPVGNLPAELLGKPLELIDLSTGKSVPHQVVRLDSPLAARPWAAHRWALSWVSANSAGALNYDEAQRTDLVFVATDVPPLGYKVYRLVPTERPATLESSLRVGEHSLENGFYRITLDPESGVIASIYDKQLEREWVDRQASHGMNQLLVREPKTGQVTAAARSRIVRGETGPVMGSLVVTGDGLGCPQRTQEIILYDGIQRIDLATRLLKDAMPNLELYLAFPFDIDKPQFRLEASNSVMAPIRDQLPGSNTDTYAVQHWLSIGNQDGSITFASLEAPLVKLSELWPGSVSQAHHGITPPGHGHEFLRDPAQFRRGHVYSYVMAVNFRTNFQPVQVADVLFRYSLTSHGGEGSQRQSREFGWAAANPLVPVAVTGPKDGPLPESASFCRLDTSNVILLTMKQAEDDDGLILRLAEMEGQDTVATVTLPHFDIVKAFATNLVEENQGKLEHDRHAVLVTLKANEIATVRCANR